MPRRSDLLRVLPAALILLLAFALRAHRLAYDSIWWDEGFSVWMSRMPIHEMLSATARDAHPPLSYALLHGWRALAGEEEFALRMQSVLFGVLTVALAYRIGALAGGPGAALASALLAAVMRLPVWWSQEIRMYAPAMFFTALSLWAALKMLVTRRSLWPPALILALSLGAGLLTLYLFAGVVLVLNLAFLIAFIERRWRLAIPWVAAQVGALAIFLPWGAYAYQLLPSWETPQAPVTLGYVFQLYLSTTFLGIATNIERYLVALIIWVFILVVAASSTWQHSQRRTIWATLLISSLFPPLLVYLLSLPRGSFNYPTPSPRYFVLLSTPVYVLLGWAIASVQMSISAMRRGIAVAALVFGLAVQGWTLSDYYSGLHLADDYQSMVAALQALRQPGDAVILNNDEDWPIFDYHYAAEYSRHITHTRRIQDEKYAAGLLRQFRERNAGVWLVQTRYAEVTDPANHLGEWLAARSWNQARYVFPEGQLWFFAMQPDRGMPSTMSTVERWPAAFQLIEPASIAEGVDLVGFVEPVPEARAGDSLVVGLGWHIATRVEGQWPIAVQLIAAGGTEIASQSITLDGHNRKGDGYLPVEVFIPPDTPGGQVQIVFVAGTTWKVLDTIRIIARPALPLEQAVLPGDAAAFYIRFGDSISLLAVDLPGQSIWHPGESIPLTLYWRAEGITRERYKVFIHLIGEAYDPTDDSNIWGQQDQEPLGGLRPTSTWRVSEIIADDYLIPIQSDALPGRYVLRVGLYLPLGGQRLPAFGANGEPLGDSMILLKISVES